MVDRVLSFTASLGRLISVQSAQLRTLVASGGMWSPHMEPENSIIAMCWPCVHACGHLGWVTTPLFGSNLMFLARSKTLLEPTEHYFEAFLSKLSHSVLAFVMVAIFQSWLCIFVPIWWFQSFFFFIILHYIFSVSLPLVRGCSSQ